MARTATKANLLLSAWVVLALLSPAARGQSAVDFSGSWKLNPKRSDDPRVRIDAVVGPEVSQDSGSRELERTRLRHFMLNRADEFREIDIEQSASDFKIIPKNGNTAIFYFGREHVRNGLGGNLRCKTHWQDSQLVIEQEGEDKTRSIQVFTLMPDGRQMIQAIRFENKRLSTPFEVRLLYDREPTSGS